MIGHERQETSSVVSSRTCTEETNLHKMANNTMKFASADAVCQEVEQVPD
jgi:hypothetical protein